MKISESYGISRAYAIGDAVKDIAAGWGIAEQDVRDAVGEFATSTDGLHEISQKQEADIIRMADGGLSLETIASASKVDEARVTALLAFKRAQGALSPHRIINGLWADAQDRALIAKARAGDSYSRLVSFLCKPETEVRLRAKALGLPVF